MSTVRTNFAQFIREFQAADKARKESAEIAVRAEGYRLMIGLQSEIKAGAPGGRQFSELREITKAVRTKYYNKGGGKFGRIPANKPLYSLFFGIKYGTESTANSFRTTVGVVGSFTSMKGLKGGVSKSWTRIFQKQQAGTSEEVTPALRKMFRSIAWERLYGTKGKRRKQWPLIAFFIRPDTHSFKTPPRDIVDPFWNAHRHEVGPNIQRNFERKLRGERI